MGWWSKLKKAVKKVVKTAVRFIKAVVRAVIRVVVFIWGLAVGVFDLVLGFIAWPPKRLRLQIFILSDSSGPIVNPSDLTPAIEYARRVLKDRFNVSLRSYSKNMVQIIKEPAPNYALNVCCDACGFGEEFFGEGGEYFAKHLAGWNGIPITLTFPITVFVVKKIRHKIGCSLGLATDYLTLSIDGVNEDSGSTMMHEMGHACDLILHPGATPPDLMYPDTPRGDRVKWWQKNVVRSSRHVTYW